ncbi:MAG: hypothetical protein ABJA98_21695 [Acidobacteriota bacterium]
MTNRPWLSMPASGLMVLLALAPQIVAESVDSASVRLRVDDYAAVAADVLARAQDEVTQLYAAIGVEATWLAARHLPGRQPAAVSRVDKGMPDLTVIVLNPTMTTRMAPPRNAIGLAASTESAQGRIAYVFYDRLRMVTFERDGSDIGALSLVMAHEIGHLLLPYGSHADAGVMLGHWSVEGFRRLDIRGLRFTPLQGQQMRRMLRGRLTVSSPRSE